MQLSVFTEQILRNGLRNIKCYYFDKSFIMNASLSSVVDKDIAHDYSQVKCTFIDPSIPPEDAISFCFICRPQHLFTCTLNAPFLKFYIVLNNSFYSMKFKH